MEFRQAGECRMVVEKFAVEIMIGEISCTVLFNVAT